MRVTVVFMGPFKDYVGGEESVPFDLPQGATYGDLLDEIGRRFGERFPPRIWDHASRSFKPGILTIGSGRDLDSREAPLSEGEVIKIVPLVAGG